MTDYAFEDNEQVSLCEAIDRILNKGAVVVGEVTISVANVDLIYLALQVVLTSVETTKHTKNDAFAALHMGMGAGMKSNEFSPASNNTI